MDVNHIFYEIMPNSEAHKRFFDYDAKTTADHKLVYDLAVRLGSPYPEDAWVSHDGVVCGLRFNTKPEGWTGVKGSSSFYFPKRGTENRNLIKEIQTPPIPMLIGASKSNVWQGAFKLSSWAVNTRFRACSNWVAILHPVRLREPRQRLQEGLDQGFAQSSRKHHTPPARD